MSILEGLLLLSLALLVAFAAPDHSRPRSPAVPVEPDDASSFLDECLTILKFFALGAGLVLVLLFLAVLCIIF